jgi:hypothetical protein
MPSPVESTLKALDEAITLLSDNDGGRSGKGRRGRIDLATLLSDLAPKSRMTLTPGAGTDVFGDEADLRRMFNVILSQANNNAASAELAVRRQEDWIKVEVELGPDSTAFGDIERRWLSRMALRHGGRIELDSGAISVLLPADAASEQVEVRELRKELEQAQQLGEAYARELGSVIADGDPQQDRMLRDRTDVGTRRFALLITLASGLERQLRGVLDGLKSDIALATASLGDASTLTQHLKHRLATTQELTVPLARLSQCPIKEEPEPLDLVQSLRGAINDTQRLALRQGAQVQFQESPATVLITRPQVFAILIHTLLEHAILATPKGGNVWLSLARKDDSIVLRIEDSGTFVPPIARADLFELRVDPSSLGRPVGIQLVAAQAAATYLGGSLELSEGNSGGMAFECELPPLE